MLNLLLRGILPRWEPGGGCNNNSCTHCFRGETHRDGTPDKRQSSRGSRTSTLHTCRQFMVIQGLPGTRQRACSCSAGSTAFGHEMWVSEGFSTTQQHKASPTSTGRQMLHQRLAAMLREPRSLLAHRHQTQRLSTQTKPPVPGTSKDAQQKAPQTLTQKGHWCSTPSEPPIGAPAARYTHKPPERHRRAGCNLPAALHLQIPITTACARTRTLPINSPAHDCSCRLLAKRKSRINSGLSEPIPARGSHNDQPYQQPRSFTAP